MKKKKARLCFSPLEVVSAAERVRALLTEALEQDPPGELHLISGSKSAIRLAIVSALVAAAHEHSGGVLQEIRAQVRETGGNHR